MDNTKEQNNNPETGRLSLEGGSDLRPAVFNDVRILKEAPQYHIDLETLEKFEAFNRETSEVQEESSLSETEVSSSEKTPWEDLDVNLTDMVNYVLDSSERPVVMISDDKIVYANKTALRIFELKDLKSVNGEPFLGFVDKADWNLLAENIGEMLTVAKKLRIKLKSVTGKVHPVEFQAVYLPDSNHFSFILIGGHETRSERPVLNNLYDELTGLPSFFLFEDRVQMAVNYENYKDVRMPKDMIAVAALSIDNIETFKKLHLEDFVLRKLANTLVLSLKKNYTVARGLKYQFWILMPDIINEQSLELEIEKIRTILKAGVSDNFVTHELVYSMGLSVFPEPARSAKKLIEQTISATKQASENKESSIVFYS